MNSITPTEMDLLILRKIAAGNFDINLAKAICSNAGWQLADDEPEFGYCSFSTNAEGDRSVTIFHGEESPAPAARMPLFYFEDEVGDDIGKSDRTDFNNVFQSISVLLAGSLGTPSNSGHYSYSHRPELQHRYSWWQLDDVSIVLVQDEFDIQFGFDISLWILPKSAPQSLPIYDDSQ